MKNLVTIFSIIGSAVGVSGFVYSLSDSIKYSLLSGGLFLALLLFAFIISKIEKHKGITMIKYFKWRRGKTHEGYNLIKSEAIYKVFDDEKAEYWNITHGKSIKDCLEEIPIKFSWDQDEPFEFEKNNNGEIKELKRDGNYTVAHYKFNDDISKGSDFRCNFHIKNLKTTKKSYLKRSFLQINNNGKRGKELCLKCLINKKLNPINPLLIIKNNNGEQIESRGLTFSQDKDEPDYLNVSFNINYPDPNYYYLICWAYYIDK